MMLMFSRKETYILRGIRRRK